MCVQQEAHRSRPAFPERQLFFRQRIQNVVVHDDLPLHRPEASLPLGLAGDEARYGGAVAGDDDLFAGFRLSQQAGKLRFGFVDVDDGHVGALQTHWPRE